MIKAAIALQEPKPLEGQLRVNIVKCRPFPRERATHDSTSIQVNRRHGLKGNLRAAAAGGPGGCKSLGLDGLETARFLMRRLFP